MNYSYLFWVFKIIFNLVIRSLFIYIYIKLVYDKIICTLNLGILLVALVLCSFAFKAFVLLRSFYTLAKKKLVIFFLRIPFFSKVYFQPSFHPWRKSPVSKAAKVQIWKFLCEITYRFITLLFQNIYKNPMPIHQRGGPASGVGWEWGETRT